jgi:FlaA1/EpsC-like NDP-sugar epimerase
MIRTDWLYTRLGKALIDALIFTGAFATAYLFRFEGRVPPEYVRQAVGLGPYALAFTVGLHALGGTYNRVWRYTDLRDLVAFFGVTLVPALCAFTLRITVPDPYTIFRLPISVISTSTTLGFIGCASVRLVRRFVYERQRRLQHPDAPLPVRRVLIVGAGDVGSRLANDLRGRPDMRIVGFADDDQRKLGTVIDGVPVRGTVSVISRLIAEHRVDDVIVALPQSAQAKIRAIVAEAEQTPARVRILPRGDDRLSDRVSGRIREVRIEDLLPRKIVSFDLRSREVVEAYSGRRVLVTGAGGSVGSEVCRQLVAIGPRSVLLLDQDENNLFEIYSDLVDLRFERRQIRRFIVDARDAPSVREIFAEHRPEVVLHAAAFKHVPLLEERVVEAVENNVLATAQLVRRSVEFGVSRFVLISTDKAVRPTSVMGATKRAAELVVQSAAARHGVRFSCVRFGNVLDSRGSVLPIFRRQIARGGPVTVTHEQATRYFMTLSEAAQFVLRAGAIGRGGDVLVLNMGQPVKIVDLARELIHLSGLREPEDIQIKFVGLRPGERLHEELAENGALTRTNNDDIFEAGTSVVSCEWVDQMLADLEAGVQNRHSGTLLKILSRPPIGLEWYEASEGDSRPVGRLRLLS